MTRQAGGGSLPDPGRRTVADLVAAWLEVAAPTLRPKTLCEYKRACELYILPALGAVRRVHMPILDKRILPAFTAEDVHKLLAACLTLRDTAMVLCLIDSGCRVSDFAALNVGDIDLKTDAVTRRFP